MSKAAISIDEFALRYGVCRATVYNEIKRGKLGAIKFGARTLITTEQERDYIEKSRRVSVDDIEAAQK